MPSISFQSLFSNVTKEFSVRRNEATDPKQFTQTVLQISDQQSRDKDYEKSLQYIRTYISSLQAKLNGVIEDLNNAYEAMLNDVMFRRADTKNTAKLLNKTPNADVDTCASATIGDPNALDITPYSKNIHNYQYNPLFASRALDMSNYSDLGAHNDVATARGYYEDLGGVHHELGSSVFGTLNYLWMWDVDRINATYATTINEFVDAGGLLHVPPGDKRINGTTIVADAELTLSPGSDTNALQVNVTALQPNRGVFKPESEDLHVERKTLLTLDGEPSDDNPLPLGGWITTYDHSGSSKRGPGLGAPWEGLNQWGIDNDTAGGYVHNGTGSLHFGNEVAYQTHDLDLVNGGFKVTSTIATQAGYLFEPELVREDFNGETTASLAAQGWNMGDLTQVSVTGVGAPGQAGDAVSGSALNIHYTGGVNGGGGSTTVSTPSFNLSEFDSTQLSSQSYYDIRGTLHGPGCIHPSCVVQVSAGGATNTQLPNTPGSDVWTNGQFETFNTNPTGAGSTSIDFNLVQKYADGNANPTQWQIDDVFLKAKGWSKGEMISPAMDFTGFDNAYVDYWDKIQTDSANDKKEVYYSEDYNDVTGTGTWILLNTANGISNRDWTNNKIEIPVGCLADPSKVRIKFAFDTVNSQTNAGLKGWNLDDIQVYGDQPEKTDFYYYRQALDSYFVAGDGTTPTPPADITGVITGWSSGAGSPSLNFNAGALSFDSTSFSNTVTSPPPVTINMNVTSDDPSVGVTATAGGNSFNIAANAQPMAPFDTDGDVIVSDVINMDLSNAATATLTFTHSGQHADTSLTGNHRKVQYDSGSGWTDLPIGASFDEGDFASTAVSISLPVGSATTKIRFISEIGTIDTDAANYWNVSNIAVATTPGAGTTKTISREGVTNTIDTSAYSGAKMSFDYTTSIPAGATNIRRELLVSTDGGFNYSSLGNYTGASGTVPGVSVPRSNNLKYKFLTSYDVPPGVTVPATSGIFDINNLKIESSATDGFNVKEGVDLTTGQIAYNTNRPNISFDSRETNIEGRYKLPTGGGAYTPIDGRTQITNADMPMFTNALLSYVEQNASVYNKSKLNSSAIWQGVTNAFPAEVIDIYTKTKRGNYSSTYVNNSLNQLLTYDKYGEEASQYMDDALAINYGLLTKAPTVADINKNDTGWVNYSTANNFFPYLPGTRYDEGNGTYKDISIWGKQSFIIDTSTAAGAAAIAQVTPASIAFQDDFEGGIGSWTVNNLKGTGAITFRDGTNTANSGTHSAYFGDAAGTSYAQGPDAAERVDVFTSWNPSRDFDTHIIEPDSTDVNYTLLTHYGHLDHDDVVGSDNLTDPGSGVVYDEAYHVNSGGRADGLPGSTAGTYTVNVKDYTNTAAGPVSVTVVEDSGSIRGAIVHPTVTTNIGGGATATVDSFVLGPNNRVSSEIVSPTIDLTNYSSATLSFNDSYQTEAGFLGTLDTKTAYISPDGGATWLPMAQSGLGTGTQGWGANSYAIPSAALNSSNVKIKFVFDSVDGRQNSGRGWNIDDVKIQGTKTIPPTPAIVTMTSDDDSYMYLNGFIVPPTGWVSWYNTTYQTWYNGAYTSWYNTNIRPYLPGGPVSVTPFNTDPYDPTRNPYDSSPPQLQFKLVPLAPTPPAPPAIPTAPPLYTNVNTQNFDVTPFLKKGFNTIAFKATEDHAGQGVTLSGSVAGTNIGTNNNTWAVKIQPSGYDGTLNTNGTNPPAKKLTSAQVIQLFQTDKPDKEQLNVNFANLDKNGVGILSKIVNIDVNVRGESTIQTYGTTTYSTSIRTGDGKMTAQLNDGYINGKGQNGGEGSTIFDPTAQDPVTGAAISNPNGLNFTTTIDGKADMSLYFDKTADIVNDATVLVKVQYYEDTNQDGILDATETSAVNIKTKYIGMQDLRSNTAINPDSDAADAAIGGVADRYAKDAAGNLLYTTNGNYANSVYENYLVAGKGRTGGADVEGNTNLLTNKLKQLLDSDDFQEVLRFGLLDNIYLAATVSDSRGDQMTGKLLLDWDWRKRRVSMNQLSFSVGYKA